ncbi:MAG: hypothetical protein ACLRHP_05470 [Blautia sp.]|uniref:hypothetical protein n=1 Tax=Blautia difficilis TaxID=2763027 RepID=UPI003A290664
MTVSVSMRYKEGKKAMKSLLGGMAAVLATQGTAWASAWALAVGFGLNIFLSNWNPFERKTIDD